MNTPTLAIPHGLDRLPGPPPAPTTTTSPGLRKVSGNETEMQSGFALMVEAYAIMWLLVFGFVWLTSRRQNELQQRIERLNDDLVAMRGPSDDEAGD